MSNSGLWWADDDDDENFNPIWQHIQDAGLDILNSVLQ
jgi:hypothetical protein